MTKYLAIWATCAAAALAGGTAHAAQTLENGRLTVGLATFGYADNSNRVDSFAWTDSSGQSTGNLAATSLPAEVTCKDAAEFFGQAIGNGFDGTPLSLVTSGDVAPFVAQPGRGGYVTKRKNACGASSASSFTAYRLYRDAARASELKVSRVFDFSASTPVFASNLRAFIPRVSAALYPTELVPSAFRVTAYSVADCGGGCEVTDWNGRWIAAQNAQGAGIVLIRSVQSKAPAAVVIDEDAYSASNASAIELLQPQGGWKSPVTEVEYVCAYDATSWTRAQQENGELPAGCAGH